MNTGALSQAELYGIVDRYSAFGRHHTGTDADAATTAWLVDLFVNLGADVHREPFTFERFEATASLTVDGQPVPVVPLFYSGVDATGAATEGHDWVVDSVDVVEVSPRLVGSAPALSRLLAELVEVDEMAGEAIALSIAGPPDLPIWCNRIPRDLFAKPVVVIPGNWKDRVAGSSNAELRFSGRLRPGRSENLRVIFGAKHDRSVRLTTPLTGWTPAAGERGTGLAVAISMARELAKGRRVELSVCSGHELDHAGLRHHLAGLAGPIDGPAVHLGASVGAVAVDAEGNIALGPDRMVLTTVEDAAARSMLALSAAAGNWTLTDPGPNWPGEGGTWKEAGASVLSFLGAFPLFHVDTDTADRATTPELLKLAADTAIETTQHYLRLLG